MLEGQVGVAWVDGGVAAFTIERAQSRWKLEHKGMALEQIFMLLMLKVALSPWRKESKTRSINGNEPNEMYQALALDNSKWGHRHKHWIMARVRPAAILYSV